MSVLSPYWSERAMPPKQKGLLDPILRFDFFHRYRNGLFSVMQNVHNVFSDCFSETLLLLFGFAGPQLDDHHEALFSPYVHALISHGRP